MRGSVHGRRVGLLVLLWLWLCLCSCSVDEGGTPDARPLREGIPRGDVEIQGLSVLGDGDGDPRFSFSAGALRLQKRRVKGGLLVYQNLKELVVSGAAVTFRVRPDGTATPSVLLDELSAQLASMAGSADEDPGEADVGSSRLTRVVFDRLAMELHLANGKTLSLQGSQVSANVDLEYLVFDGPVVLTDAEGVELYATEGLWSRARDGIHLPVGYTFQGEKRVEAAFFGFTPDGRLEEQRPAPAIAYEDELAELDDEIYTRVFEEILPIVWPLP